MSLVLYHVECPQQDLKKTTRSSKVSSRNLRITGESSGTVGTPMAFSTPKTLREISERSITETKAYLSVSVDYPSNTAKRVKRWPCSSREGDCLWFRTVHCQSNLQWLKNVLLKKIVVEKVLKLMTSQNNGICSSKQPSMLTQRRRL